ncbi:MAG: hypothetical protein QXS42_06215 [Zestosphaera sp.]
MIKLRNRDKVIGTLKFVRRFYDRIGWGDKVEEVDEIFMNSLEELFY